MANESGQREDESPNEFLDRVDLEVRTPQPDDTDVDRMFRAYWVLLNDTLERTEVKPN